MKPELKKLLLLNLPYLLFVYKNDAGDAYQRRENKCYNR